MPHAIFLPNSLVLYRTRPARVCRVDEKVTIETEDGAVLRVRQKDVELLHPGPITTLTELAAPAGDVPTAWEILSGATTSLAELAELVYGAFTPASAWAAWQILNDGLYFRGTPDQITVCSHDELAARQASRAAEEAERVAWEGFRERARAGRVAPEDRRYLREVEDLALGRAGRSRVLAALGHEESPENAHAMLLKLGYWDEKVNPFPVRFAVSLTPPDLPLPAEWREPGPPYPGGERLDLSDLPALAIDDAWTDTPDDALSLVAVAGGELMRLWVHVADAAALVMPDDALDREARGRGLTLYLPETTAAMLPSAATPLLGLGLAEQSPALSLGIDCNAEGEIAGIEIMPSLIHATRLTYEDVDRQIDHDAQLRDLWRIMQRYELRRRNAGARNIDLPEVDVRVLDGEVVIRPIAQLRSRTLVENAMIMAGEAVARHASRHGLPMPYATQEAPDTADQPVGSGLAAMFAARRTFRRGQYRSAPAGHNGLGLEAYLQVTSPLRRYLDLVAHQQLRAQLTGSRLLDEQEIIERIGAAEASVASVRQAEHWSVRHWTLVYLLQHPRWRGLGVLVEKRGSSGVFILPELALETHIHLRADLPLDSEVELVLQSVDLARQDARFHLG